MDKDAELPNRRSPQGFSLLEVLIATGILAIMCAGVLTVKYKIEQANREMYDRTVAFRAAHQAMEVLLAEDMDLMLLQNGNTFGVTNMNRRNGASGKITITDLNWTGPDKAYEIRIEVPELGVVLTGVRARS